MSTLINKNITVDGHRTSMRLEPEMWDALKDICRLENIKIGKICSMVNKRRSGSSLTSAMRVFIIAYYRAAAMSDTRGMNVVLGQRQADGLGNMYSPMLREALNIRTDQGAHPSAKAFN